MLVEQALVHGSVGLYYKKLQWLRASLKIVEVNISKLQDSF